MVGQRFILLLNNHPWFKIVDVAASKNSANKSYKLAVSSKWVMDDPIPNNIKDLKIRSVENFNDIPKGVKVVFSAVDLSEKEKTRKFEFRYAKKGYAVISTSSANRGSDDVPMIIPEINHDHLDIIKFQQKKHHLPDSGLVVVKPNCSIQSYVFVLDALKKANYKVDKVQVTTLQALSGAGYQALSDNKLKNNVVPFINGEEEKTEIEPAKIFGSITGPVFWIKSETPVAAIPKPNIVPSIPSVPFSPVPEIELANTSTSIHSTFSSISAATLIITVVSLDELRAIGVVNEL